MLQTRAIHRVASANEPADMMAPLFVHNSARLSRGLVNLTP